MAKFGVDATNIGDPRTPHFIDPGVVDQSAGMMANTVAKMIPSAITAYEGTVKMDQRLKQDEAITQYENYVKEPERLEEAAVSRNAADSIWDRYGNQDVTASAESLNMFEERYNKAANTLVTASKQGKMNDQQVLARLTQITREAVQAHPWMESELYSAAQTHLKAMGITGLLETRANAADAASKRDEATMKFYREQFAQANMIDQWDQNAGEAVWQKQLQDYTVKKRTIEAGEMVLKKGKIEDATLMRRVLAGEGQKFHELSLVDFQESLVRTLGDSSSSADYDSTLAAAKLEAEKRYRAFRTSLGPAAATPEGKELLDNIQKDYGNIVTTLTEAGNATNSAVRLKNGLEALKTHQEMEARSKFNPILVDLATKVVGAFGDSAKLQLRDLGLGQYKSATKIVTELFDPKNAGEKTTTENITSGAATGVFSGILKHQEGYASNDGKLALTQIASTINSQVASGNMSKSQSMQALNGMLKTIAQNADKMQGQRSDPQFAREVTTSVKTVMQDVVPNLTSAVSEVLNNPANKGANIELDVLPNGSFTIKTGNPEADRTFNQKFSNQINNALDAYAAANGMSREKAASMFYTEHFSVLAKDPDLLKADTMGLGANTTIEGKELPTESKKKVDISAEIKKETQKTRAQEETRKQTKREVLGIERTDMEKEIYTSEAALKSALSKGINDERYLNDLRSRIDAAKKSIQGIDDELKRTK